MLVDIEGHEAIIAKHMKSQDNKIKDFDTSKDLVYVESQDAAGEMAWIPLDRPKQELVDELPPYIAYVRSRCKLSVYRPSAVTLASLQDEKKEYVTTDDQAIEKWRHVRLAKYSEATAKYYLRGWLRFQMWRGIQKGMKHLYEVDTDDIIKFGQFLLLPPDVPMWIYPHPSTFGSKEWRPFKGLLTLDSAYATINGVGSLFAYLHKYRYLDINPVNDDVFAAMKAFAHKAEVISAREQVEQEIKDRFCSGSRRPALGRERLPVGIHEGVKPSGMQPGRETIPSSAQEKRVRTVASEAMDQVVSTLKANINEAEALGATSESKQMQRCLLGTALLYYNALRAEEVITLRCVDVNASAGVTKLHVLGKGSKKRVINARPELLEVLQFIADCNTPIRPESVYLIREEGDEPLLKKRSKKNPQYSYAGLYRLVKDTMRLVRPDVDEKYHPVLNACSPHWLRHAGATKLSKIMNPFELMKFLGHESVETTTQYVHES